MDLRRCMRNSHYTETECQTNSNPTSECRMEIIDLRNPISKSSLHEKSSFYTWGIGIRIISTSSTKSVIDTLSTNGSANPQYLTYAFGPSQFASIRRPHSNRSSRKNTPVHKTTATSKIPVRMLKASVRVPVQKTRR